MAEAEPACRRYRRGRAMVPGLPAVWGRQGASAGLRCFAIRPIRPSFRISATLPPARSRHPAENRRECSSRRAAARTPLLRRPFAKTHRGLSLPQYGSVSPFGFRVNPWFDNAPISRAIGLRRRHFRGPAFAPHCRPGSPRGPRRSATACSSHGRPDGSPREWGGRCPAPPGPRPLRPPGAAMPLA